MTQRRVKKFTLYGVTVVVLGFGQCDTHLIPLHVLLPLVKNIRGRKYLTKRNSLGLITTYSIFFKLILVNLLPVLFQLRSGCIECLLSMVVSALDIDILDSDFQDG